MKRAVALILGMLVWFDNPHHYWVLGLAAVTASVLLAVIPAFMQGWASRTRAAFIVVILLTLLAGRWPALVANHSLEFDETFHLIAATTAAVHPVPWKSFDPDTAGPINVYLLDLPKLFGYGISYSTTHFVTIVLLAILISCLYLVSQRFIGEAVARVAVLPLLVFFSFTFDSEFMHYASEIPSLALACVAMACAVIPWSSEKRIIASCLGVGLALGAMPFAKLQSVPLAAFIVLVVVIAVPLRTTTLRRPAYGFLALGLFAVPALILVIVTAAGAFRDFVISYLEEPFTYVAGGALQPLDFVVREPYFGDLVALTAALAFGAMLVAATVDVKTSTPVPQRLFPYGALGLGLCSLYAVFEPHRPWTHYVLLLTPSLALLLAAALGLLVTRVSDERARRAVVGVVALVAVGVMLKQPLAGSEPYIGHLVPAPVVPFDPIAAVLKEIMQPGEGLAIWGFDQDLYPETGALLGTRDVNPTFEMVPSALQPYYRARYAADMAERLPRAFVDAVAPGALVYTNRATDGYETFPALAALIRADYHLICDVGGSRIFEIDKERDGTSVKPFTACEPPALVPLATRMLPRLSTSPLAAPGSLDGLSIVGSYAAVDPTHVPFGSALVANGWIVEPTTRKPGRSLVLIVDGRLRFDATRNYGRQRFDVAGALGTLNAIDSGFVNAPISRAPLSRGRHLLQIGTVGPTGKVVYVVASPTSIDVY